MKIKAIPIVRAAHLLPYIHFLRKIGAPVERLLGSTRLPLNMEHNPDLYLPVSNTLHFLTRIARNEGIDNLGLRATLQLDIDDLSQDFLAVFNKAPTLYLALQKFCALGQLEDTTTEWWMTSDSGKLKLCSKFNFGFDMLASQYSDWNRNMAVLAIIRKFAESNWCPDEMAFQSTLPIGDYARGSFPNTRFLTGQEAAWVSLPRSILSMPAKSERMVNLSTATVNPNADQDLDFPGSLKLVLQAYLGDGYPDIHLAAELSGTSVRTLQRRLKQAEISYSSLVHQVQFEYATQLLKHPHLRTLEIAYAVGYEDPSNFARAFRRIAGVSPNEYRRLLQFS